MKNSLFIIFIAVLIFSCSVNEVNVPCFLMASEPTHNSIILSARINASDTLVDYDIKGVPADISFEITQDTTARILHCGPLITHESDDFIARHRFTGLEAGKTYFYRIRYILPGNIRGHSAWQSFRTLAGPEARKEVSFVLVTGMNFYRFSIGRDQNDNRVAEEAKLNTGFPGFISIASKEPDFFIGNGDNVYYDQPLDSAAKTPPEMRKYWHRLFQMRNFQKMASRISIFWMKDDHDYRYNDSDTLRVDKNGKILLPSHEDGIQLFLEQASFSTDDYRSAIPYRTYRLNRDVQVWMVEGRDFRSPNPKPDGPDKSMWGDEQKKWLKETLLESTAKYKLLISPTPMVGPDDAYKIDNHTNPGGFRYERDEFVTWLKENNILGNGFYVLCGDRHWQYHSLHPDGLEEFSCGALVDANSRLGRLPGDPKSTDPEGKITQYYTQDRASGGFLQVSCLYADQAPFLRFCFYDENGVMLYSVDKRN